MAMSQLGERNASIALGDAGVDFIKYAKILASARGKIGEA